MFSLISLVTKPKSLEPISSIISDITIAGRNLYEMTINYSSVLQCEETMFFAKENINLGIKEDHNTLNNKIVNLKDIEELKNISKNVLLVITETVMKNELVKNIKEKIKQDPKKIHLFGSSISKIVLPNKSIFFSEKNYTLNISEDSRDIQDPKRIYFLYIPQASSKLLLHDLISRFYSNDDSISRKLPEISLFHELDNSSVLNIDYPWQIIDANEMVFPEIQSKNEGKVDQNVVINGPVVIEAEATILQGTYINGPVFIAKGATIGPNCFLRGNTYIGENVKIGQSVEIKNSIILNDTHVGHLSYIGDSFIGPKNNFGAGSKTANLAFHDKSIKMIILGKKIDTGRRKLGIITGRGVKTGINSSLMPGIKLFNNSIVGAHVLLQTDLDEQMICSYNKKNELTTQKHNFY